MNGGKRRINLLAGLVERLPAGLHPGKDALGGLVEGLLDLRIGRAAPDARLAVTRSIVEQPGDPAERAGPLEEGLSRVGFFLSVIWSGCATGLAPQS